MDVLLQDNWKKESKKFIVLMIFIVLIAVGQILVLYFRGLSSNLISLIVVYSVLFCIALYGYLSCAFYKFTVYEEKIIIKTLLGKKEILLQNIEKYSYKQFNKRSEVYEFKFTVRGKKIILFTHYSEKLHEFLQSVKQTKDALNNSNTENAEISDNQENTSD